MEFRVDEPLFYRLTFDSLFRRTLLVLRSGAPIIFSVSFLVLVPGLALKLFGPIHVLSDSFDLSTFIIQMVLTPLATGALVYSIFKLLRGQELPPISRSLALAGASLPSLVVASVITAFLTSFGLMCFLIPGLIVMAGLALVAPVIMVEKAGPILALNRSWELSEGYRLTIFGMIGLIWLVNFGLGMALLAFSDLDILTFIPVSVVEFLGSVVTAALTACTAGVAYHDLRLAKDELGEDELLAVFE